MATGGSCSSLTSDKRESLTCALCLDIFKDPKLLTCAHTFCQKCLEDLIQRHPQGSFPCPACRKDIHIPAEGASGFQANFYIDQEELERAKDDTTCSVHAHKKLDRFCVECDLLICIDCKYGVHLDHKTQILQDAKRDAANQLPKDTVRLKKAIEDLEKNITEQKTNQEQFKDKKAVIESRIRRHHATIVAKADTYMKEALRSLEESCSETEDMLSTNLQTAQSKHGELKKMKQKIDAAMQHGESCRIVNTATEVRTGCGSEDNVRKMEVKPLQHVSRPVHLADIPEDDAIFVSMRNFIGSARLVTYDCTDCEVKPKEETQGSAGAYSAVFCVCPENDDTVTMSFEPSFEEKDPKAMTYSTKNKTMSVDKTYKSRTSFKSRSQDTAILFDNNLVTNCFVKCASEKHYFLTINSPGSSQVKLLEVVPNEPFKATYSVQYPISCGVHRAVDVNSSAELLAVVEEHGATDKGHKVRLFRRGCRCAVDIYQSPLTPCQPTDVCFFTLAGQEVLLIADELNDAIHVVEVKDGRLTFSRFLTPGCPVLVQPTALNTDRQGRLWVGCRGGTLLTMEPVPMADADAAAAVDVGDDKTE